MTTNTLLSILQKQPFVEALQSVQVERLAAIAKQVQFTPNEVIFREGDECHVFYLIVSGRVALEMAVAGRLLRVETLGAGDEFGWSAFLSGRGKYFQARVLDAVEAIAFDAEALLKLCREDTALGFTVMQRLLGVVSERLQATRLQVIDTYSPLAARAGT